MALGDPRLILDGATADLASVTFRRRGLGPRKGFPRTPFALDANRVDFCTRFAPHVESLREDLLADDRQTGAFDPAYEGATSHPDFAGFLALPEAAQLQLVNTFLAEDLLALWFVEESRIRPAAGWP